MLRVSEEWEGGVRAGKMEGRGQIRQDFIGHDIKMTDSGGMF